MKSYNFCKQSKQFLVHQKRLNIQTYDDYKNISLQWKNTISNIKLQDKISFTM